jgi:hypothetical protein
MVPATDAHGLNVPSDCGVMFCAHQNRMLAPSWRRDYHHSTIEVARCCPGAGRDLRWWFRFAVLAASLAEPIAPAGGVAHEAARHGSASSTTSSSSMCCSGSRPTT